MNESEMNSNGQLEIMNDGDRSGRNSRESKFQTCVGFVDGLEVAIVPAVPGAGVPVRVGVVGRAVHDVGHIFEGKHLARTTGGVVIW